MTRRPFFRLLLVAGLALALVFPAASEARVKSAEAPAPPALTNTGGPCVETEANAYAGINSSPGSRNGVTATIAIGPYFANCGDVSAPSGTSAWVAIEGNTAYEHDILQIGIVECDNILGGFPGWCNDTGAPHFFYEKSGCSRGLIVDLGTADFGSHTYTINRTGVSSGSWRLYIDSVLKVTVNTTDIDIWCWQNSSTRTNAIRAERHNRGDSWAADTDGYRLRFTSMWWVVGSTWVNQNSGTACSVTPTTGIGTSHCRRTDGINQMDIWSTY